MANKRGPEGDGYGPSVLPGAPIPPAPAGPAIGVGGAAAGIPPPLRPLPNGIGGAAPPEPPPENEATTVRVYCIRLIFFGIRHFVEKGERERGNIIGNIIFWLL